MKIRMLLAVLSVALAGCPSVPRDAPAGGQTPATPTACENGTLGMEAVPVSRALRARFSLPSNVPGAVIGEVLLGGPAALAGLRPGDIVLRVGGTDVRDDCEFDAVAFQRSCEPVDVLVARGAEKRTVSLTPADGLSFLDGACREGARGACNRRALVLWTLARSEAEKRTAIEAFASACRVGDAEACANGGLLVQERPGREGEAVPMLERACALGSAPGCSHLAFLHATGTLVPRNDATATPLYVRSCELGDVRGCYNEALMFENGRGVPKDQARAVAAYSEACEEGRNPTACTNLGFLVERGLGVRQSAERAVELYGRGCAGAPCQAPNLAGCVNLARSYRDGKGVAKDVARAARMFQDICEKPVDPGDLQSAEVHQSRACALLGGLYLNGSGVPKDLAKGRSYSEIGCSKGDAFGCFNGGVIHSGGLGVPKDLALAAYFYDKGCLAGDGESCFELAKAHEKGNGVAVNKARAAELLTKACASGFAQACRK